MHHHPFGFTFDRERAAGLLRTSGEIGIISVIATLLSGIAVAIFALTLLVGPADARVSNPRHPSLEQNSYSAQSHKAHHFRHVSRKHRSHRSHHRAIDANGNFALISVPTAARINITVHPAYAAKFQALIADLVAQEHRPRFITCYARGHKSGSNHAWGGACDIDQTGWGRTSGFMYHAHATIRGEGLFDGCDFGDCGHVEAMKGLHNHPPNLYAAVDRFKQRRDEASAIGGL